MQRRGFLGMLGVGAAAGGKIANSLGSAIGAQALGAGGPVQPADMAAKYAASVGMRPPPYDTPEYKALNRSMRALLGKRERALSVAALEHLDPSIAALKSVPAATKLRMHRDLIIESAREESAIQKAMSAVIGDYGPNALHSSFMRMLDGLDDSEGTA